MIMRSTNNHNTRHQPHSLPSNNTDRPQRGSFMGLRTKAPKAVTAAATTTKQATTTHNHNGQHRVHDDLDIAHSPRRSQDDFLPNPRILDSPTGAQTTPPKKIWEGAYRNFLTLGKSNSPQNSDLSKSPSTDVPQKKSGTFTIMPGTKRLVTQVPHSQNPAYHRGSLPDVSNVRQRSNSGRVQSMTVLDDGGHHRRQQSESGGEASEARAPSFLKGVFSRSTSDGSVAVAKRARNYSNASSPDDLDSAMRNGMNRHSPDYAYIPRKQASSPSGVGPPPPMPHVRTSSQEDIPSGLDALLAGASISPHYTVELSGVPRAASYNMIHRPMNSDSVDSLSNQYPFYIPKRESCESFNHSQAGLNLEEDSSHSSSQNHHHRSRSLDLSAKGPATAALQAQGSGVGSLLAQQVAAHTEMGLDQQHHHHYQQQEQMQSMHPQHVQFRPSHQPGLYVPRNEIKNGTAIRVSPPETVGGADALLHDPRFVVQYGTPTGMMFGGQSPSLPHVNPEMKKLFTTFHNEARFARDATSPFLGGESPSPIRHDSYVSYHMMMGGGGMSMPYQAYSAMDLPSMGHFSTSLPLEPVDENDISIHKGMRLLKPIEGTEKWESGRRYLIAPAVLAACPLTVLNRLSGTSVRTAQEVAESPVPHGFGTIDLGECLMTYIGDTHHLSLGQWASCRLVLRQNYLLEYDTSTPITGLPRGFIHLQHARASAHVDFQNALELDFFASPCAKADRRLLMIRADTREQCAHWIKCLNKAAQLQIKDLWEYDGDLEFGRGRYAAVYPARRRTESSNGQVDEAADKPTDRKLALSKYNGALKIIDKAEFWRRVVKGRERADTLVREAAVQSTLTAKCGKLGSFLQLRGFFETSEHVVIELELLEGTDLFKHISSKGVLKEHEAATILRDMLTSLEAMNRVGLAHRDIKPANVLMCDREKDGVSVKIGDFGMSTFVGVDGLVRGRCGTPGYVAPEILIGGSGGGYTNEVDIFSAGVTLYVMLCGYEPFYGENEKELIEANKRAKIEFPEDDWGRISNDARDLVLKMTQVDPRQRISAKAALQHPWITRLDSGDIPSTSAGRNVALSAGDVPTHGACVIS